jgi:hypothetical protein
MPTVFRRDGCRFFFFSDEGEPSEPVHVHVRRGADEAKFWLKPDVAVAKNFGFNASELNVLLKTVRWERVRLERAWNDHFGHKR